MKRHGADSRLRLSSSEGLNAQLAGQPKASAVTNVRDDCPSAPTRRRKGRTNVLAIVTALVLCHRLSACRLAALCSEGEPKPSASDAQPVTIPRTSPGASEPRRRYKTSVLAPRSQDECTRRMTWGSSSALLFRKKGFCSPPAQLSLPTCAAGYDSSDKPWRLGARTSARDECPSTSELRRMYETNVLGIVLGC